jgi:hypothetical protein
MTSPQPVRRRPPPTPDELHLMRLGLAPFVVPGDRLTQLPAKQGRRIRVLEHIAGACFEPGRDYDEAEVNELLERWCEGGGVDHVTVRRYLIDYGILSRDAGTYRRT